VSAVAEVLSKNIDKLAAYSENASLKRGCFSITQKALSIYVI
jgi:hypothetical protein